MADLGEVIRKWNSTARGLQAATALKAARFIRVFKWAGSAAPGMHSALLWLRMEGGSVELSSSSV